VAGRDRPEGGRPLQVEADLTLTVDGEAVDVAGYGDLVVVEVPSLRALRELGRGADLLEGLPLPAAAGADLAAGADVTVDVRVRGVSVARIEPGRSAGPLADLLGVAPARPSLVGLLRALLRELRG
jgi:hypothetical protein